MTAFNLEAIVCYLRHRSLDVRDVHYISDLIAALTPGEVVVYRPLIRSSAADVPSLKIHTPVHVILPQCKLERVWLVHRYVAQVHLLIIIADYSVIWIEWIYLPFTDESALVQVTVVYVRVYVAVCRRANALLAASLLFDVVWPQVS